MLTHSDSRLIPHSRRLLARVKSATRGWPQRAVLSRWNRPPVTRQKQLLGFLWFEKTHETLPEPSHPAIIYCNCACQHGMNQTTWLKNLARGGGRTEGFGSSLYSLSLCHSQCRRIT